MLKKVVSITGGSGFVGSLLVLKHLEKGDEVRVLSRKDSDIKGVKFFKGDLTDPSVLNANLLTKFVDGSDIVYHCAGEIRKQSQMYDLHVNGTKRLLELVSNQDCQWVQLSSVGAYGVCDMNLVNESFHENPQGIYEQTKTMSDELVRTSGLPYTILRPSTIFGSNMNNKSLEQMTRMIQRHLFFYMSKDSIVNYVHVNDVVSALMLCADNPEAEGKTYILSDSSKLDNMVNSISDGLKVRHPSIYIPKVTAQLIARLSYIIPNFPLTEERINALTSHTVYSSSKIKSELGFSFERKLSEAFYYYARTIRK